ncbi:MAG: hypothetical protein LBC61_02125 [Candidatus Peribacteria bacterium]|jgi:hypothetical protein|nr:hypothetical protein [Candidatus Peribacteria bacterium]
MKNIIKILSLLLFFAVFSEVTFAGDEEDKCFEELNKAVKNDVRFSESSVLQNKDLTKVLYNEQTSTYIDLSKYSEFKNYTSENPAHNSSRSSKKLTNKDFLLRR